MALDERREAFGLTTVALCRPAVLGLGCEHRVHHLQAEPCGISYEEMRRTFKEALRNEQ